MAFEFILNCALDVAGGADVLDIDNWALVLLARDLHVDVHAHITSSDVAIGDVKAVEHLLKLTDDQLGVVWVSFFGVSVDLEEGDSGSVEVDVILVVLLESGGGVLNSNTCNQRGVELLPAPSGLSRSERSSPGL